ncbi:MAG: hypothetical protein ABIH37_05380 [archaeon]
MVTIDESVGDANEKVLVQTRRDYRVVRKGDRADVEIQLGADSMRYQFADPTAQFLYDNWALYGGK